MIIKFNKKKYKNSSYLDKINLSKYLNTVSFYEKIGCKNIFKNKILIMIVIFSLMFISISKADMKSATPQATAFSTIGQSIPGQGGDLYRLFPLTTIPGRGGFDAQISIAYSSSDNTLRKEASDAGRNFIIASGGAITRSVRGVPDDYKDMNLRKDIDCNNVAQYISESGWLYPAGSGIAPSEKYAPIKSLCSTPSGISIPKCYDGSYTKNAKDAYTNNYCTNRACNWGTDQDYWGPWSACHNLDCTSIYSSDCYKYQNQGCTLINNKCEPNTYYQNKDEFNGISVNYPYTDECRYLSTPGLCESSGCVWTSGSPGYCSTQITCSQTNSKSTLLTYDSSAKNDKERDCANHRCKWSGSTCSEYSNPTCEEIALPSDYISDTLVKDNVMKSCQSATYSSPAGVKACTWSGLSCGTYVCSNSNSNQADCNAHSALGCTWQGSSKTCESLPKLDYLAGVYNGNPDSFFVSVNGQNVEMTLDQNNKFRFATVTPWKIDYSLGDGISQGISQFTIITEDGTKYIFGDLGIKTFNDKSICNNLDTICTTPGLCQPTGCDGSPVTEGVTTRPYTYAWPLTQILSNNYKDIDGTSGPSPGDQGNWIKYNYTITNPSDAGLTYSTARNNYVLSGYIASANAQEFNPYPTTVYPSSGPQTYESSLTWTSSYVKDYQLSSITTPLYQADLVYSQRGSFDTYAPAGPGVFGYSSTPRSSLKKLDQITLKQNPVVVPNAPILKTINLNYYSGNDKLNNQLTLKGFSEVGKNGETIPQTNFTYHNYNGNCGNGNGENRYGLCNNDPTSFLLESINYPTGGKETFNYELDSASYFQNVVLTSISGKCLNYGSDPSALPTWGNCGSLGKDVRSLLANSGTRIKKIVYDDSNGKITSNNYYYDKGVITSDSLCQKVGVTGVSSIVNFIGCEGFSYYKYDASDIGRHNVNNIIYGKITNIISDGKTNGKTENYYTTPLDFPNICNKINGNGNCQTSLSYQNGRPIKTIIYQTNPDGTYSALKESFYKYNLDDTDLNNYAYRPEYSNWKNGPPDTNSGHIYKISLRDWNNLDKISGNPAIYVKDIRPYPGYSGVSDEYSTVSSATFVTSTQEVEYTSGGSPIFLSVKDYVYPGIPDASYSTASSGDYSSSDPYSFNFVGAPNITIEHLKDRNCQSHTSIIPSISGKIDYYNCIPETGRKIVNTFGYKYNGLSNDQTDLINKHMLTQPGDAAVYSITYDINGVQTGETKLSEQKTVWASFNGDVAQIYPKSSYSWLDTESRDIKNSEYLSYDNFGNVLSSRDAKNYDTHIIYDSFKKNPLKMWATDHNNGDVPVIAGVNEANPQFENVYDEFGNLNQTIDINKKTTLYKYDGLGRLKSVNTPEDLPNQPSQMINYCYALDPSCDHTNAQNLNYINTVNVLEPGPSLAIQSNLPANIDLPQTNLFSRVINSISNMFSSESAYDPLVAINSRSYSDGQGKTRESAVISSISPASPSTILLNSEYDSSGKLVKSFKPDQINSGFNAGTLNFVQNFQAASSQVSSKSILNKISNNVVSNPSPFHSDISGSGGAITLNPPVIYYVVLATGGPKCSSSVISVFTGSWDYPDSSKLLISNNPSFTNCNYANTAGCICASDNNFSSTSCQGTVPAGSLTYYAKACDSYNQCSSVITHTESCVEDSSCTSNPSMGTISVSTTPGGASIYLEDKTDSQGITAANGYRYKLCNIVPGKHVITTIKEGYYEAYKYVDVQAGGSYTISLTLNPSPKNTKFNYSNDPLMRITSITNPDGTIIKNEYSVNKYAQNNVYSVLTTYDENNVLDSSKGKVVKYYDRFGNLAILVDQNGKTTSYDYDSLGRLKTVTNANNQQTINTYDSLGRLKTVTNPDFGNMIYTYDDNGNILSKETKPNSDYPGSYYSVAPVNPTLENNVVSSNNEINNVLSVKDTTATTECPNSPITFETYLGELVYFSLYTHSGILLKSNIATYSVINPKTYSSCDSNQFDIKYNGNTIVNGIKIENATNVKLIMDIANITNNQRINYVEMIPRKPDLAYGPNAYNYVYEGLGYRWINTLSSGYATYIKDLYHPSNGIDPKLRVYLGNFQLKDLNSEVPNSVTFTDMPGTFVGAYLDTLQIGETGTRIYVGEGIGVSLGYQRIIQINTTPNNMNITLWPIESLSSLNKYSANFGSSPLVIYNLYDSDINISLTDHPSVAPIKVHVVPGVITNVVLSYQEPGTINVNVLDSLNGNAKVSSATVNLTSTNSIVTTIKNSDINGLAVFNNVDIGSYSIKINKNGYFDFNQPASITSGGQVLNFNIPLIQIRNGTVKIQTFPYGALVKLTGKNYPYNYQGTSDISTGRINFTNVFPQDYTLTVSKTGLDDYTNSITLPNGYQTITQNVQLNPAAYIPTSEIITYQYDGLNRLKTVSYNNGEPNVVYTYDQCSYTNSQLSSQPINTKGKLCSVYNGYVKKEYVYNNMGRVTYMDSIIDGTSHITQYTYDHAGNVVTVVDPLGNSVSYLFNNLGKVQKIYSQGKEFNIKYNKEGTIGNISYPNQINISYDYNSRDLLSQFNIYKGNNPNTNVLLKQSIIYDAVGNIKTLTDLTNPASPNKAEFMYDNSYKLTKVYNPVNPKYSGKYLNAFSYSYDNIGNRQSEGINNYIYQSTPNNNKLSEVRNNPYNTTITDYTYDFKGNLKTKIYNKEYEICNSSVALVNGKSYTIFGLKDNIPVGTVLRVVYDKNFYNSASDTIINNTHYEWLPTVTTAPSSSITNITCNGNIPNRVVSISKFYFDYSHASDTNPTSILTWYITNSNPVYYKIYDQNKITQSYTYDSENRLTRINYQDGTCSNYYYDESGMRIKKIENNLATVYTYNGINPISESSYPENGHCLNTESTFNIVSSFDSVNSGGVTCSGGSNDRYDTQSFIVTNTGSTAARANPVALLSGYGIDERDGKLRILGPPERLEIEPLFADLAAGQSKTFNVKITPVTSQVAKYMLSLSIPNGNTINSNQFICQ